MFRCAPIVSTNELNCDHPCSPDVWDAADATEFALAMAQDKARYNTHSSPSSTTTGSTASSSPPSPAQSSLREFLTVLMADKWNRAEQCPRDSFNVFDLNAAMVGTTHLFSPPATPTMIPASSFSSSGLGFDPAPSLPYDATVPFPSWLMQ